MASVSKVFQKFLSLNRCHSLQRTVKHSIGSQRHYSVFEPDDVNLPPEIPEYSSLSICMRGYDYVTLESFAKYVHGMVNQLDAANDSYPVPRTSKKVQLYKPRSTYVSHEYQLHRYQRDVKVNNLQSTQAPLLLEILKQNVPEGIEITVKEPTAEEEEFRYVPDLMVQELRSQIAEIDQIQDDRRKK